MQKEEKGITVKKEKNMPEWFEQVCLKAELAEFSDVKGCMVIRPNGYAIWETIQDYFNKVIKKHNVRNAAFPLLIPESYFKKEAEHAKGFAPEVAWVTKAANSKLEEPLAIRPTSETLISKSFKRWLRSYKDLPIKVNQWCSVVRWETKQTKLFIRSREFWWQEGHCIYETEKECLKETLLYLQEYKKLCEEILAVPVLAGKKTIKEKFAGAKNTYAVEALMPDGKALQMGTSHDLGQGFMKAFEVNFIGKDEKPHIPYYNSWGISTRLMGGLIMTHSDDKGLVLPPKIAQNKAVIIPILFDETKKQTLETCKKIKTQLKDLNPILDKREEYSPGWKFNEWELKGIPLRIEIGPRDLEKKQAVLVRRDIGKKEFIKLKEIKKVSKEILEQMQNDLFKKAKKHLESSITKTTTWNDFIKAINNKKLALAPFCGDPDCEDWIKDKAKGTTSRVISEEKIKKETCIQCKKPAKNYTYFSRAY